MLLQEIGITFFQNFRGANNHPLACGSQAAIQDIRDAITWCLENLAVDSNNVHITGTSGGGYMTMICYMELEYPVKSFNAWVGISDLESWFYESLGRNQKYAKDILSCTESMDTLNIIEAKKRSPLHIKFKNTRGALNLYAGVHDGYNGSVPITHSIHFFNKIIKEKYGNISDTISDAITQKLLVQRNLLPMQQSHQLANRNIHVFKKIENISICIFEGGHESITHSTLPLIENGEISLNTGKILAIGDSNGASQEGWVNKLKNELPFTEILNESKSGRTIGFNNNNDSTLNGLIMLENIKRNTLNKWGETPKTIIISLGTNDAKRIFYEQQKLVKNNIEQFCIKTLQLFSGAEEIIWVAPPPIGHIANNSEKYKDADKRVQSITKWIKDACNKYNFQFINASDLIGDSINYLSDDGIHMHSNGQKIIATNIVNLIKKRRTTPSPS